MTSQAAELSSTAQRTVRRRFHPMGQRAAYANLGKKKKTAPAEVTVAVFSGGLAISYMRAGQGSCRREKITLHADGAFDFVKRCHAVGDQVIAVLYETPEASACQGLEHLTAGG